MSSFASSLILSTMSSAKFSFDFALSSYQAKHRIRNLFKYCYERLNLDHRR